jgi:hypothetical protein
MLYAKAALAVLVTVVLSITTAMVGDNPLTPVQWINVAISGISAIGVYYTPNVRGALYAKTIIAVLLAVLAFVATVVVPCTAFSSCHIATRDILQMIIIGAGALGVFAVPNSTAEARSANP